MGIIYCYTSPSGKKYVGQTSQSVKGRAWKNGEHYKECTAFWRAIQKHGWNSFSCEVLEETNDSSLLNELEIHYIKKLNTLAPNGYNIKLGNLSQFRKPVLQYDLYGTFIREWDCSYDAAKELNITYGNIIGCCKHRGVSAGGFIWQYPEDNQLDLHLPRVQHKKAVVQLDKTGNLIKRWNSIGEASRGVGAKSTGGIWSVCQGKGKTAQGFRWMYSTDYDKL